VRFVPLSLMEARRIYDIQRCRGLRLRPWAPRSWLPIIVPLFVSQMCRAHDTSVMLVVRRIVPGNRATPARKLGSVDWLVLGLALVICIQSLL
jgi:energy-coupling factor transporter transmembrane protein EcfT